MKKYWIVIADAGRALVLNKGGNSPAELVHDLENPAGRTKTSQLVSDESGRMAKMRGDSKSAMDPPTDPHEQKAVDFAREISHLLETTANKHEFDSLMLVAPGHFLGLLHSRLGVVAGKRLVTTHTRDLVHASMTDLQHHISQWI